MMQKNLNIPVPASHIWGSVNCKYSISGMRLFVRQKQAKPFEDAILLSIFQAAMYVVENGLGHFELLHG